jgi:hypothetical protein
MVQGRIYNKVSYIGKYCGAHNSGVQSLPSQAFSNVHRKAAASNIKSSYHWPIDYPNRRQKTKQNKARTSIHEKTLKEITSFFFKTFYLLTTVLLMILLSRLVIVISLSFLLFLTLCFLLYTFYVLMSIFTPLMKFVITHQKTKNSLIRFSTLVGNLKWKTQENQQ